MKASATFNVRVVARTREADDIVSLELASVDGAPLPPFSAGAHIEVILRPGLVRQYSLCNDPSERHRYLIAVLRDLRSRGGSQVIHDDVAVGDVLAISAPKNHFPLVPATRYLLLAGGIGVTPILCMAERLANEGANFEMHYCTRAPERAAFRQRIVALPFAERVRFYFDATGDRLDIDATLRAAPADTHLYVCGPGGFIDAVISTAKALEWADERVHTEYFGAALQDGADQQFEVRVASTGRIYAVPAGHSVVQILAKNGVDVPVSCEQGVCGTCLTRVLDGTPDHRDHYLTDEERAANDQFTPCCSRAKTPLLVLDL